MRGWEGGAGGGARPGSCVVELLQGCYRMDCCALAIHSAATSHVPTGMRVPYMRCWPVHARPTSTHTHPDTHHTAPLACLPFRFAHDNSPRVSWVRSLPDFSSLGKLRRRHDLVVASYVLSELGSANAREKMVRQLWEMTGDVLVLVEPGGWVGGWVGGPGWCWCWGAAGVLVLVRLLL